MNRIFSYTVGLTLCLSAASVSHANQVPEDLCNKIKLDGTYKSDTPWGNHVITMTQRGCLLYVIDNESHKNPFPDEAPILSTHQWRFDLSGQTEFDVPTSIIDANISSELGFKSLKTFRGRTKLIYGEVNGMAPYPYIEVSGKITLPETEANKIAVDLAIETQIFFNGGASPTVPFRVSGIQLERLKTRVVAQHTLPSLMSKAFIMGANYALAFLDRVYVIGIVLPALNYLGSTENCVNGNPCP